ncbi:HigA family addiction module antitoxin [Microbacterium sp.]|uniref:HigA family addiction module antitoxin n=1 Tax=Microbacterium sp. TaxID=51671 RepID=UPI0039E32C34
MDELKPMYDPPHPGELLLDVYLPALGMSGRELAVELGVAPSTLSRVLNGSSRVTPEMALRLSKALGASAESWLAMQNAHDLWVARSTVNLDAVRRIDRAVA